MEKTKRIFGALLVILMTIMFQMAIAEEELNYSGAYCTCEEHLITNIYPREEPTCCQIYTCKHGTQCLEWTKCFEEDTEVLARMIYAEGRGFSVQDQYRMGRTVINRFIAGYGDTITEVITAPGQYHLDGNVEYQDLKEQMRIARDLLWSGYDPFEADSFEGATEFFYPEAKRPGWVSKNPKIELFTADEVTFIRRGK